jgi:dynein heavy chain
MIDAFMANDKAYIGVDVKEKNEIYRALLEKWFVFSLIWSFGGSVNEAGRKLVDYHMRDIDSMFPHADTVYDYSILNEKNEW